MSVIAFPTPKTKSNEVHNYAELLSEAFKVLQEQSESKK